MDQINLTAWEGRTDIHAGGVSAQLAAQLHATLGNWQEPAPAFGDPVPALWHWTAFTPTTPTQELGTDGHPPLGDFLPPIPLRRRMWAGGEVHFRAPIQVGEPLQRRSFIGAITEKAGATGPMYIVSVEHAIYGSAGLAISERNDIVYLDIPDSYSPPPKRPMPDAPLLRARHTVTETTLFRYSSVTFNAHRIHYDAAYARDVEHYPGLVIHGPLQATCMMQMACGWKGRTPDHFHFRGVHPMILGAPLDVMATEDEGGLTLYAGQDGHQGMKATAIWEDTV